MQLLLCESELKSQCQVESPFMTNDLNLFSCLAACAVCVHAAVCYTSTITQRLSEIGKGTAPYTTVFLLE